MNVFGQMEEMMEQYASPILMCFVVGSSTDMKSLITLCSNCTLGVWDLTWLVFGVWFLSVLENLCFLSEAQSIKRFSEDIGKVIKFINVYHINIITLNCYKLL